MGETFRLGRLTFTVLEMEEQKIEKMRFPLRRTLKKQRKKDKGEGERVTPPPRKGTCYEYRENECP